MDTRTHYREIVKEVISKYARLRPSHGAIRLDTVFDEQQDHYALMQSGWDHGVRVRGNLIYVTLHDGKVPQNEFCVWHGKPVKTGWSPST